MFGIKKKTAPHIMPTRLPYLNAMLEWREVLKDPLKEAKKKARKIARKKT